MLISLNAGKQCLIDDTDAEILKGYKLSFDGRYAVAYRTRKKEYVHRLVVGIHATGKKIVVDHINGDRLDNRRSNLRITSASVNQINRRVPMSNLTGLKGVSFSPETRSNCGRYTYLRKKPYVAEIKKEGHRYRLGRFESAEAAHAAYRKKAMELFGADAII